MPSTLLERAEERLPSWYVKTPSDTFVLVKAYVSDDQLCQPPLLVLPGCKIQDVSRALHKLAQTTAPCFLSCEGFCFLLSFNVLRNAGVVCMSLSLRPTGVHV